MPPTSWRKKVLERGTRFTWRLWLAGPPPTSDKQHDQLDDFRVGSRVTVLRLLFATYTCFRAVKHKKDATHNFKEQRLWKVGEYVGHSPVTALFWTCHLTGKIPAKSYGRHRSTHPERRMPVSFSWARWLGRSYHDRTHRYVANGALGGLNKNPSVLSRRCRLGRL